MFDQNPLFKLLVFIGVCVGAYRMYCGPDCYPRPDDPWFRRVVLERSGPVLVKFGATWCGPCRMLDAELTQLGSTPVVKIDVQEHRDLARNYSVSSIPRLLLFKNGKIVGDRVGCVPASVLRTWIAEKAQ